MTMCRSRVTRCPRQAGFSLVEMMIGMIIFTVGVVGFAGMVMLQAKGNQITRKTNETATLIQSTIEDFAGICYDNLGTDTASPSANGRSNADIDVQGPMNRNGEVSGTGSGPYVYMRYVVICTDSTGTVAASTTPNYCNGAITAATRPPELECTTYNALTNREKIIRVLVTWTDNAGNCHFKNTDSISFDWDGTTETC